MHVKYLGYNAAHSKTIFSIPSKWGLQTPGDNTRLITEAPAMLDLIKELACVNDEAAAILDRIDST